MFRLAVWLCLATRARGDGQLVLTSPGYAAVGVGEALVFEVVDASGAAAAPVVRVGGEVAEALRSARPLADNATAWTFRLFLELGAHTVEACAGRCVPMIARVVRPAGHRSLQSFYHGRGDCAFTESERVVLLLDDVAACGTLAHHRLRVVVEPPADAIERRAVEHSLLTSLACAAATELVVAGAAGGRWTRPTADRSVPVVRLGRARRADVRPLRRKRRHAQPYGHRACISYDASRAPSSRAPLARLAPGCAGR